ncbi:hypothetical protein RhiJN_01462 [Ceratobasidium sp. AG-Ba]|nr:hypothetical protein RhiJN_01462 [Ceratobasidium sp. AG-Ba]
MVEPPKPPKDRPAVPRSLARKQKKKNSPTVDEDSGSINDMLVRETKEAPEPSQTVTETPVPEVSPADITASSNMPTQNQPSTRSNHETPSLPTLSEDTTPAITSVPQAEEVNSPLVDQDLQENAAASSAILNSALQTPRQPNRLLGLATPAVLIIQNSPHPPRSNYDDTYIAPFVPNTSTPFDAGILTVHMSPAPSCGPGLRHSGQSELAPPEPCSSPLRVLPAATGSNQGTFRFQPDTLISANLDMPAPLTNFNSLYTTVLSTMPPILPPPPTAIISANPWSSSNGMIVPYNGLTDMVLHEAPGLQNNTAPAPSNSVPLAGHGGEPWRAPASEPISQLPLTVYHPHANPRPQPDSYRPNNVRQGDFSYNQVAFIQQMAHAWGFYLAAVDLFPINVFPAQEFCTSYAEKTLGASRVAYQVTQKAWDYVRKKDSNIRNTFQTNLLKQVEECYNVTAGSGKIDELLANMNFAHVSYDVASKKINGRYLNPCVAQTIKIALFTKRSRGRPIGMRFIHELMGITQGQSHESIESLGSKALAPVAIVAVACTLVYYALQAIKAGDSSNRVRDTAKPVNFSKHKYRRIYQTIVARLKKYSRIAEVQKAHMEGIMKEYLIAYSCSHNDSDKEDLVFDDEMVSDGE